MSEDRNGGILAPRVSPTVSKDKWTQIALNKLAKGWIIIIADGRKSSNFFKPGSGYDPLPFSVATKMVAMGLLKEAGKHALGKKYTLSERVEDLSNVVPVHVEDEEEDVEEDDDFEGLEDISEIDDVFEEAEEDEEGEEDDKEDKR